MSSDKQLLYVQNRTKELFLKLNKIRIAALVFLIVIFGIVIFIEPFTFGANIYSFLLILVVVALALLINGITRRIDIDRNMNENQIKMYWIIFISFMAIATLILYFQGVFTRIDSIGLLILLAAYQLVGYAIHKFIEQNPVEIEKWFQ